LLDLKTHGKSNQWMKKQTNKTTHLFVL
jgi:hypothetical protein